MMELAQHTFQQPLNVPPSSNGLDKQQPVLQQQSVIQSNQHQLQQQLQTMHDGNIDSNGKRREILARRPSYRRILDDLAVDGGPVKLENYEDTGSSGASSPSGNIDDEVGTQSEKQQQQHHQQQQQAQYTQNIHLNGMVTSMQTAGSPLHQLHESQAQYTIKGQLPVGLETTTLATPHQLAEEATRKRELRLYKNREAARECRRKKKEYVKCLENRVAVLENQNKALIEELKSLKDLYCSKGD